ncbi:hypothetical protein F3D69_05190 [Bacteroides ovatus]|uniref:Uncharacterized protein n=1 Tax=Bacteroides ovatus TaxID=28116 RepID=A0A5M5EJD9_BACOV|nr:hypothetical protein F3F37_04090 [Bacteroides ovatus]KAA4012575.1 hypothetical protein F3D64_02500 [Bacteroides ovatus]KAA4020231.1 hypothetical protein F3D53_05070 [Bacteroides ovatus]KAA4033751.1 hypothetical protein F3D52_01435 [Bacteroides ovatus]KAA4034617.1 hypothetical protein F3D60_05885 [Bacteroides ovatus]
MKLFVSHRETKCFTPGNHSFHTGKLFVSHRETFCFTPGNFLFQTGMKLSASNLRLSFYIFFKKKVLTVEYGIRKEINPVSKYQHT